MILFPEECTSVYQQQQQQLTKIPFRTCNSSWRVLYSSTEDPSDAHDPRRRSAIVLCSRNSTVEKEEGGNPTSEGTTCTLYTVAFTVRNAKGQRNPVAGRTRCGEDNVNRQEHFVGREEKRERELGFQFNKRWESSR